MRHFLTLNDCNKDELLEMIDLALDLKKALQTTGHQPYLKGKILAMIFEKSSTRTRVSFESGIYQLGGLESSFPIVIFSLAGAKISATQHALLALWLIW